MFRQAVVACAVVVLLGLLAGDVSALEIKVSPNVLVVYAPGDSVRIHTDVPYANATLDSLSVNEVGIGKSVFTFADSCGNLVIGCSRSVVVESLDDTDTTAEFKVIVSIGEDTLDATDSVPVKRPPPHRKQR